MKRTIAVLMAVMMLVSILTACSGSVGMDDGRAYGNVSTTPNGRVNGGGYSNDMNGAPGTYSGYGNNMTGGNFGANNATGRGMTGGR